MENFFCKSPIFYQQKQPSIASLNGPILSYIQSTCLKVRLMWSQRRSFPTLYPAEQFQRDICRVQYFHTTYLPRLIFLDVQDFSFQSYSRWNFFPVDLPLFWVSFWALETDFLKTCISASLTSASLSPRLWISSPSREISSSYWDFNDLAPLLLSINLEWNGTS